jgi:hypothetical protein
MKSRIRFAVILAIAAGAVVTHVQAFDETHCGHNARWRATLQPWHGYHYNVQYGAPTAVVVPPTVELQTDYGWGVANKRTTRINHQFQRPYPGVYQGGVGFLPTPYWPGDTRQFGYYYVRGPW